MVNIDSLDKIRCTLHLIIWKILYTLYLLPFDFLRPRQMRLEAMLEGESPAVRGQEQSRTFRRRSANVNIQKCIHSVLKITTIIVYVYW